MKLLVIEAMLLCLIILCVGMLLLKPLEKYTTLGAKKIGKFGFRGTNRQDTEYRIDEELEKKFSKWFSPSFIKMLTRAGYKSAGEFILMNLVVVVIAIIADLVIYWFFRQYWWMMIPFSSCIFLPVAHTYGKLQEHEKSLVMQAPIFASVINREFARYGDFEIAFRRASWETTGWISSVFLEMADYLQAVKGDVHGALDIFKELNTHPIAEQFTIAIKNGYDTNNVTAGLTDCSKTAIAEKKKYVMIQIKKKDATIFLNVVFLLFFLMGQITYILFAATNNTSFFLNFN